MAAAGAGVLIQAIGLGMTGVSLIARGAAGAAAGREDARRAEVDRRVAQIQADQIDASYRDELDRTFRNITAIQASAGAPINSPSTIAYMNREAEASDMDRQTAVANARLQADAAGMDAYAFRRAARWSLGVGIAQGASSFAQIGSLYANRET